MDYDIKDINVLLGYIEWQRMRDTIYDFFNNENTMPDDLLLFYYSGHGIYDDGDLYLAASEMDPYIPSRRGFNFDELRRLMNDSISTSIVAILDCCSSGAANLSKGHEVDVARLARSTIEGTSFQGEGRCILESRISLRLHGHVNLCLLAESLDPINVTKAWYLYFFN